STLASEHWDDELPLLLANVEPASFEHVEMPLYDPDSKEKIATLIANLDKADYVILSSNRLRLSVPRDRVSHPISSRYYDLLFSGQLGFELKQEFTSYPGLLGISVSDDGAEESQSSYDHPRVLIFEKTPQFSRSKVEALLGDGPFTDVLLTPKQADHNGLLLSPSDLATQRAGGTWASVFSDSGLAKSNPTLLWLLALEAAALAMTPIAFVLFRRLPDRGYLLAKPLGLFVLGYIVWLLPSLKLTHFDQTEALIVLATMLVAGGVVAWRARESLQAWFGEHWCFILVCEALFILAFLFFRELRMENPDLWHPYRGGEKPMDLAYLTAVARSTTLPPYDPWFAGGYINYYYLGQFFTATLIKLTTIPPEIAFNLAIPTYFALAVGGAFSVSCNLAHKARSLLRRRPGFASIPRWSVYAAGLLGVLFVTIAGNFDALDQLSQRLAAVSSWHLSTPVPLLDAFVNGAGGLYQASFNDKQLPEFDFWRSSRMMPPTISITEFPYFSFLFADLHAHMMAIPFQLLSIGLGLVLVFSDREPAERRTWALVALIGLLVGGLRWLNSWDYPPFLLLALTAVAIGERRLEGGFASAAGRFVTKAALLAIVSVVAWQPFLSAYQTPVAGLHPTPETTPLRQYLAHFGIFLAPIAAWLLFLFGRALRSSPVQRPGLSTRALPEAKRRWVRFACVVVALTAVVCLILGLKGHIFVAALVPPLVLVGYLMLREALQRRADGGLRLYVLALAALGLGLSAGVDLVTLDGDIERMNTVFKFYLHAWIVFALVATFASWYLVFVIWPRALAAEKRPARRYVASAGLVGLTMLLLAAVVYPLAATRPRLDDRFAGLPNTLDGTDYMKVAIYQDEKGPIELKYDLDGIEWMRQNVEGTPAIVEGNTGLYKWGGRFSIYTGLPAVLGWDWHQTQQRGELAFMVDQRLREVESFYGKNDVAGAQAFLRKYDVRYVILGQAERLYYPAAALRKFDSGLGGTLEVAYKNPKLTIYRVKPDALVKAASVVAASTSLTSEAAP
ncbi:MAG TPA: DUF2298 domain-containing protein, partial [Dehalococcoidia bacterium]|nr:DUF2298 domain-containing protein [Dehalococcoidia bacterium]